MTGAQAAAEFNRLCKELGRDSKRFSQEQTQAYLRVLEGMSYERGRAAVTHLVDTWTSERFPPPGAITKAANEVSLEGHGGAAAYFQNGDRPPWHRTPEGEYLLWRQMQIECGLFPLPAPGETEGMADEERSEHRYWAYAMDERGYRTRCDNEWRSLWERRQAQGVGA